MSTASTRISTWGDSLALRLTKPQALLAGLVDGTHVRITAEPGRIVVETITEPSLEQMLLAFDPARHGGEAMASAPASGEVVR